MRDAQVTIEQACEELRAAGIQIGVETLRQGIKQGVFPFKVIILDRSDVYIITKKKLHEFIRSEILE